MDEEKSLESNSESQAGEGAKTTQVPVSSDTPAPVASENDSSDGGSHSGAAAAPTADDSNGRSPGGLSPSEASPESGEGEKREKEKSDKKDPKSRPRRGGKGGPRRRPASGSNGPPQHLREGAITEITADQAIVDLGAAVQGIIPLTDFRKPPEVGEKFQFSLESLEGNRWILSRKQALAREFWSELKEGLEVEARVSGENSGGLELKVGPIAAFMPSSQIEAFAVSDLSSYMGKTIQCVVLEVNRKRRRLVVSHRALIQKDLDQKRKEAISKFSEGDVVAGKVARLEGFGAFVEISEGLTGLLHVSNISRRRVNHPSEVLSVGQEVQVKILELKGGGARIGLGMKQLEKNPWDRVESKFRADSVVTGKVTRITDFGAFVELAPGVEGLVHISQFGRERLEKVEDATKVGHEFLIRVVSVDAGRQRISLSRLNSQGALIGSDEAVESNEIQKIIEQHSTPSGTNLGMLLREAMEKREGNSK